MHRNRAFIRLQDVSQGVDYAGLDVEIEQDELTKLNGLLQWMEFMMELTRMTLQISQGPRLALKSDWKERLEVAKLTGTNQFMSSKNMRQFLDI